MACEAGKFSLGGSDTCDLCETGSTSGVGSSSCLICPPGSIVENFACEKCPQAKYANFRDTVCIPCSGEGEYSDEGAFSCSIAAPGYVPNSARSGRVACEKDFYSEGGQDSCTPCPQGEFSERASAICLACVPGEIFSQGARRCLPCPPGYHSRSGKEEACLLCDAQKGLVAPEERSVSCLKCGAGKFASQELNQCELCAPPTYSQTATNRCLQCPPSQISNTTGATICHSCEGGKAARQDQLACNDCPSGTISNSGDQECSECAAGKFSTVTTCSECDSGKYSNTGSAICMECDAGTHSTIEKTSCKMCQAGRYSNKGAGSCSICDAGTECPEGSSKMSICPKGRFSGPGSSDCTLCDIDKGLVGDSEGRSTCALCGVGKYASSDSNKCMACPSSYYSVGATSSCSKCDVNKYSNDPSGARSCQLCVAGKIVNSEQTGCDDCPAGFFSKSGDITCSACEAGKYIAAAGGSACVFCNSGKYSTEGSAGCKGCESGQVSNEFRSGCIQCDSGYYAELGASSCTICDGGTKCEPGSSKAIRCNAGRYAPAASGVCLECKIDQFTKSSGQSTCQQCPPDQMGNADRTDCVCKEGFVSVVEGGKLLCLCAPGEMLIDGSCSICPPGMYKPELGNTVCTSCDKSAVRNSFSTWSSIIQQKKEEGRLNSTVVILPPISPFNCTCEKGDYFMEGVPEGLEDSGVTWLGYCVACPEGAACDEAGVTVKNMPLKQGWWRSDDQSVKLEKCRVAEACLQNVEIKTFTSSLDKKHVVTLTKDFEKDMQCEEGHTGPLCNVCIDNFSKNITGICESCDEKFKLPAQTVSLIGVGVLFALVLIGFLKRKKSVQFARIHRHVNYKSLRMAIRTKFKILVCYYQIVTQYERLLGIHFPPVFERFLRWISTLITFDAFKLGSIDCFVDTNFYTGLVAYTVAPLVLSAIVLLATYLVKKCLIYRGSESNGRAIWEAALEFFLGLAFFTFSSVSTRIFDTFNCASYSDDETKYLIVDESINCDLPLHTTYKIYAGFMMVFYPIGIPILFGYLLVKNKDAIKSMEERKENMEISKLSFLWSMYEPHVWWFEIFECVRRLMMTGMLIFVSPGSASQIVLALILATGSIVAFVHWRPYEYEEDDDLAIACQISIFFTIFGALLIRVEIDKTDEYNQELFGQLLITVNLLAIFILAANYFQRPISWMLRVLNNDSTHSGSIKAMGGENQDEEVSDDEMVSHFEQLAMSEPFESGYTKIKLKNVLWVAWARESGAWLEWRNDAGDGQINEGRVKFTVNVGIEELKEWIENVDCEVRSNAIKHYQIGPTQEDGKRILYTSKKLPFPFRNRDYLTERVSRESQLVPGAHVIVLRSIFDEELFKLKKSSKLGFARATMRLCGYFLLPLDDGSTEVTFIANIDLGGLFPHSNFLLGLKWGLKHVVDSIRRLGTENTLAVREGANEITLGEERNTITGLQLGNVFTGAGSGQLKRDSSFQVENPMAKNASVRAASLDETDPAGRRRQTQFQGKLESTNSVF
ncbi:hypothetical protein TrVE_jg10446 [Triparma verrucosa]|uniref:START domain-containing protein n=1 Tax=Triparma verrucosa TaxID=1606542 RepID=A0A9W7F9C3_9STRA|nr:hypothetical protein TrVE_jg10446 [Triparma verrucosa]